jgi:mannose-6-phosphate isomerase-like protein (cupin superfamily)
MPCTSDLARVFYIVEGMLALTIGEETITVTRGIIIATAGPPKTRPHTIRG